MKRDYFGELELEDGHCEVELKLGGRTVTVDMETDGDSIEPSEIDALAEACKAHQKLCNHAKERVSKEYMDLSIRDGFSVWAEDDPSLLEQLDPSAETLEEVDGKKYADLLYLGAIHLNAGSADDPGVIVFDLRFGLAQPIDYLVAATFSLNLSLEDIALES